MNQPEEIADTAERCAARGSTARFLIPATEPVALEYGAATHPGKVRERNEDHFAVVRRTRSREILSTNVPFTDVEMPVDEAYVLIVADGVGGEGFGDLASQLAIRAGWESTSNATSWIMRLDGIGDEEIRERVAAVATAIQQAFLTHCQENPRLSGMATTWTCAYITGWDAIVAHVGDSRAYWCRNESLRQITQDHTLAEELRKSGVNPDDIRKFRSVLTRAFSGTAEEVVPDVHQIRLHDGEAILVCSDGLTHVVKDEEIARVVADQPTPQAACDALVALALERGAPDNVTTVLARVSARR